MNNPTSSAFFEQLRTSTYQEQMMQCLIGRFKESMTLFVQNAIKKGEINEMPMEVYWSVAFAPLYSLLRFHTEGRSIGGKPFFMNDDILWKTFDLVIMALSPQSKN
jgi:hypothetical protein